MQTSCWLVFLIFIGLSSFANWEHGNTRISSFMLAVVPVGFAASIFILEGIVSVGKATAWTYAGIAFVAAAAGVASYLGLYGMARESGIPIVQSSLLPLAFDGVVAVASMGIRAFSIPHTEEISPPSVTDWDEEMKMLAASAERTKNTPPEWSGPVASLHDVGESEAAFRGDTPLARKERAPRSSWDVRKVAEMLLAEERQADIISATGIGRSTLGRYSRVVRLLKEDPRAEISSAEKVPAEHVQVIRELVRR